MAVELTDANFSDKVMTNDGVAVVDFWATWCGPCKMISPIIDEVSKDFDGKAVVGKVDVDSNSELSVKYNVRSIPTILVFKNGEVVDRHVGVITKAQLESKINAALS